MRLISFLPITESSHPSAESVFCAEIESEASAFSDNESKVSPIVVPEIDELDIPQDLADGREEYSEFTSAPAIAYVTYTDITLDSVLFRSVINRSLHPDEKYWSIDKLNIKLDIILIKPRPLGSLRCSKEKTK